MSHWLLLAASLNLLSGLAVIIWQRKIAMFLGWARPRPLGPLHWAGAAVVLLGVAYWYVQRAPQRRRALLLACFAGHLLACDFVIYGVTKRALPPSSLWLIIAAVVVYLAPLTLVIRRLYAASRAMQGEYKRSPRLSWVAFALAAVLPASWALGHVVSDKRSRWIAQNRPAGWTVLRSNLPGSVGEEFPYATVEAWPGLRFIDPTLVLEMPDGSGRMVVLERRGRVLTFPKNASRPDQVSVLLDIRDRTIRKRNQFENGLLGLAFHPRFAEPGAPQRGWVFVRYASDAGGRPTNRLSRFTLRPGDAQLDPDSEQILIELPEKTAVHKGGSVAFGPDGFLYTTFGTDGREFPHEHAQRIDFGLWAGVLRIDVDCQGGAVSHPPPRQPAVGKTAHYFIPNDNPFVGRLGALEEFYSIGFRNPWRMSIDPKTGQVWVGDVGDRRREEVNIAFSGSNHQFDYREGSLVTRDYAPGAPERPEKPLGTEAPPLFEYERDSILCCVIGGYVYRGKMFPELVGKYVYADQGGRIFAISVDDHNKFLSNETIAVIRDQGLGVSSLGEDADGELYVCFIGELNQADGRIYRLERGGENPAQMLPPTLSATGLMADVRRLTPNPALMSYEVNVPLWSDRAIKRRWIGLACTEKIAGYADGSWQFPRGTVFVKHFDLPLDERQVSADEENLNTAEPRLRRLETRVLVCDDRGGVYGASYRWNDDQSEAYLVNFAHTEEISYIDKDGRPRRQTWLYPSRFDCLACHTALAGGVLGFNARQLNRDALPGGPIENQLVRFSRAGLFEFDCTPADAARLAKLAPLNDESASLEHRVRSYLDANCAQCHLPGGTVGAFDARFTTPLGEQRLVDAPSNCHSYEDPQARIVCPGDLAHSMLYVRMAGTEHFVHMPPLAGNVVHQSALDVLRQWIMSLPSGDTVATSDDNNAPAGE